MYRRRAAAGRCAVAGPAGGGEGGPLGRRKAGAASRANGHPPPEKPQIKYGSPHPILLMSRAMPAARFTSIVAAWLIAGMALLSVAVGTAGARHPAVVNDYLESVMDAWPAGQNIEVLVRF